MIDIVSIQDGLVQHIQAATGARKFNMGTIFVFQTLQGIESGIKLILSQLGGFNFEPENLTSPNSFENQISAE